MKDKDYSLVFIIRTDYSLSDNVMLIISILTAATLRWTVPTPAVLAKRELFSSCTVALITGAPSSHRARRVPDRKVCWTSREQALACRNMPLLFVGV